MNLQQHECYGTAAIAVGEKREEFPDLEETTRPWSMTSKVTSGAV